MKSPAKKRTVKTRQYLPSKDAQAAEKLTYIVGGIILGVLALRFIFMMIGADRGTGLTDFIFSLSRPFVEPFFALFSHGSWVMLSGPRFEFETLLATGVYAMVVALIGAIIRRPARSK